MTLRRKMAWQIAAMIAGLLLVTLATLWGLRGLQRDYDLALRGYEQLRELYSVGSHLGTARALLSSDPPNRSAAASELAMAASRLELFEKLNGRAPARSPDEQSAHAALGARLLTARNRLQGQSTSSADADAAAVNATLAPLSDVAAGIRRQIQAGEAAAARRLRSTTIAVAGVSLVVIAGAVLLGVRQYRAVVRPLNRLGAATRRIAAGRFSERVSLTTDGATSVTTNGDEFAQLADDFNRMAAQLESFYRDLEQKVAQKSRELIQSERLASVGYLAAGVAHEINNPLGIITGYAELALARLREKPANPVDPEIEQTLRVICEEAFRCRDITAKLLSLARPGDGEQRVPLDLSAVAEQVVSIVSGLRQFEGRRLTHTKPPNADLRVLAAEAEIRQVVINLVLNALESVAPAGGEVQIDVSPQNGNVQLSVTDNGRGMTPQTLERIFEPFYTEKRGERQHGTGLGLSISHAIIESHGGRIQAHSDGPGKGSRFVVSLPAIQATGS